MRRFCLTVFVLLVTGGCQTTGRVLDELPAPLVRPTPRAAQPKPTPAPPTMPPQQTRTIKGTTIVVDAGHGGKDPGAVKPLSRLPEKTIVLDIGQKLAAILRQRGARVIMTRVSDVFVELDDRAAMADRTLADLLVSVHADSAHRLSASGMGLYIARNASKESQRIAHRLDGVIKRSGVKSRGIHRAGLRVLVGHSRPSILVECGFLSNAGDARKLNTPAHRARVAQIIADGITDHFSR